MNAWTVIYQQDVEIPWIDEKYRLSHEFRQMRENKTRRLKRWQADQLHMVTMAMLLIT